MLHLLKRGPLREGHGLRDFFVASTLQAKLRIGLIPPIIIVLILTGYLSFRYYAAFINETLDRVARLQVQMLSRNMESFLATCAEDVRFFAR